VSETTSWTRGEWMAVGRRIEHVDDDVPDIANFDPASMLQEGRSDAECCANARLCGAAPAMYSVLDQLLWACESFRSQMPPDVIDVFERAYDALRNANPYFDKE